MQAADRLTPEQTQRLLSSDHLLVGAAVKPPVQSGTVNPLPQARNRRFVPHASHQLYLASGIIMAVITILLSVSLATSRTSWFGRAQTTSTTTFLSKENSYLFASPITATADGVSIVRITIFVLNNQGLGVEGQMVELKVTGSITVAKTQHRTDSLGRAIFDLTSSTRAECKVSAEVGGLSLPQSVSISFQ